MLFFSSFDDWRLFEFLIVKESVPMSTNLQKNDVTVNTLRWGCQGIDIFVFLILVYSVWEGKDRGSFSAGLFIGVGHAIVYFFVAKLYRKFIGKTWLWLSSQLPHNLMTQLVLDGSVIIFDLVFLYFPFLFLIWKTNVLFFSL